jgi:hypothetical protein
MTMRALLPLGAAAAQSCGDVLEAVQALEPATAGAVPGAELLQLSPPLWNEAGQMFQLAFEGRACCMSNKNVQLVSDRYATLPTLQAGAPSAARSTVISDLHGQGRGVLLSTFLVWQVGKLRKNLFNVDLVRPSRTEPALSWPRTPSRLTRRLRARISLQAGHISPYTAFAIALSIFDQSSVRRRF